MNIDRSTVQRILLPLLMVSLSFTGIACNRNQSDSGNAAEPSSSKNENTGAEKTGNAGRESAKQETKQGDSVQLPNVSFTTVEGEEKSLDEYRGTPVVINFWGTWCAPCKEEMPHFQETYEAKDGAFKLIGFAVHDKLDSVKKFKDKIGITYPLVLTTDRQLEKFQSAIGPIRAFPTTLFVNGNGNVVDKHLGMLPPKLFDQKLNALLEE